MKLPGFAYSILKEMTHVMLMIGLGFFGVLGILILGTVGYLWYLDSTLPDIDHIVQRDVPESSKLYSRDGTLLYEFHGEYKRTRVSLDQISPHLKEATLAVEDKDFYKHGAISITGIVRAIVANYKNGEVTQGGSTITQQFVKNALLDRDRTFSRKIKEMLLAYKIESHFSKDEILQFYLNEIPYGRNAYGAEAAAQTYFGKSAADVSLSESAYLAALPQAPGRLSPTGSNPEALEKRKEFVLQRMYEQGYITELERHQGTYQEVAFKEARTEIIAPHFVAWIQNYLTDTYGPQFLREGGLKVYTTLDLKLQALAEKVVKEGVEKNTKQYGGHNAALVAVEPSTGKILAMVGGKDYFGSPEPRSCTPGASCKFEPQVNVATSQRQPGSSFKVYNYLTAFKPEFGLTPTSKVLDAPVTYSVPGGRPYSPKNYDGSYHGLMTVRKALAGSLNVPSVKVMNQIGVDSVVQTAKSLGITSPLAGCGLSLALGGCEVELVDHVSAFAVLANGGKGTGGTPFLRIEDKHGNILEQYQDPEVQAVNPEAVYELISIMTDDASRQYIFGRNNPLTLPGRTVAAKTGTTQNWKDGWTLGFTPQLAAGVWVGNNDSSVLKAGADGVFVAAPLWRRFMEEALKDQPAVEFSVPQGIVQIAFDPSTGRPTNRTGGNVRMEPFPWYAVPKEFQISAAPKSVNNILIPVQNRQIPVEKQKIEIPVQEPATQSAQLPQPAYRNLPEAGGLQDGETSNLVEPDWTLSNSMQSLFGDAFGVITQP